MKGMRQNVAELIEFYLLTLPVYLWQALVLRCKLRLRNKGRWGSSPPEAALLLSGRGSKAAWGRIIRGAAPFALPACVMPAQRYKKGDLTDLMVAQYQRLAFADHLATCELGLFPPRKLHETDEQFWTRRAAYLRSEHDLRMQIANRLN